MGIVEVIVPGVALSNRINWMGLAPVTPTIGRAAAGSADRQNKTQKPSAHVFMEGGMPGQFYQPNLIPPSLIPLGSD
jgi:hypothetical protein